MNPNPESRKLTFLELIKEYKIEIPIIQRDYAQGREEKSELRDDFLNTLSSIVDNKKVELDFVYGSVKNGVFQPLDGQQRLTTLFLMHWFIALKENKLDEDKGNTVANIHANSVKALYSLKNLSKINFNSHAAMGNRKL